MIPPALAVSAASTALDALSSLTGSDAADRNDVIGQQEFLTLLVTQLQNQDPLNPLDSADFSAQLAQFSSLEQLMQINQRLGELAHSSTTTQLDPVGFLGREVGAAGSSIVVSSGEASELAYSLEAAGQVTLELRDASGNVVTTASLGEKSAGEQRLDLGQVPGLASLADGVYAVRLTVQAADGSSRELATTIRGTVTGIDLESSPPVLLIGPMKIPLADVREIRSTGSDDLQDA